MASTAERVRIHYRRPPDREQVFDQAVLLRTPDCVVTFLESARLDGPVHVDGRTVLEAGSPIVWFTFPGAWHDIGRFHASDGTFYGLYANVLTPVEGVGSDTWRTTDLFLDVWQGPDGAVRLLDADELATAVRTGTVDEALARRAEEEAASIMRNARAGSWPPPIVAEWTLSRALETMDRR